MNSWISITGWIVFAGMGIGAIGFVLTSILEQRWKAIRRAALLFVPAMGGLAVLLCFDIPYRQEILLASFAGGAIVGLIFALPIGRYTGTRIVGEVVRADEREAIFHRFYKLRPGTPEFEEFYTAHPELKKLDEEIRKMPGLGKPGSDSYDPHSSLYMCALADVLNKCTREIDWKPEPINETPTDTSTEELTKRLKGFARYLGADLVGTTVLNPVWVYSHIGRSPGTWGEPIQLEHTHAIAIATEMDHDMVRHGPDCAITTETTLQYFEVGKAAMVLARYLNFLGYDARAHVDGNYRVLCCPIAADAGLGELGRLGLLVTPKYGPRVRLSVVTTTAELLQDEPIRFGVQHFCEICKKCATCCPSASVDTGEKGVYRGVEKWKTNQDTCYRYWRMQGSDCGVCMKVCPYSHPTTLMHNLVRRGIRHSNLARHAALWGDDFFYGRCPTESYPLPEWHGREDRS